MLFRSGSCQNVAVLLSGALLMEPLHGTVASLFLGDTGTLSKAAQSSLEFAFDGIVGDRHRGLTVDAAWCAVLYADRWNL